MYFWWPFWILRSHDLKLLLRIARSKEFWDEIWYIFPHNVMLGYNIEICNDAEIWQIFAWTTWRMIHANRSSARVLTHIWTFSVLGKIRQNSPILIADKQRIFTTQTNQILLNNLDLKLFQLPNNHIHQQNKAYVFLAAILKFEVTWPNVASPIARLTSEKKNGTFCPIM
jgi:hypothetical protein